MSYLPGKILNEIVQERVRQMYERGYDERHDDEHTNGDIALFAALYALPPEIRRVRPSSNTGFVQDLLLPLGWQFKHGPTRRAELVRAAALIIAEIERLDRAAEAQHQYEDYPK